MKQFTILIVAIIFFISGCNTTGNDNAGEMIQGATPTKAEDAGDLVIQPSAKKAKEMILPMKEIKEMRAVDLGRNLYVALEFKHRYTLQSQKLIEKIKKKLDKEMPTNEIKVTSDHKIFIELEKLEEKIKNKEINKNKLNQKLNKLDDLLKQQI